VRKAIRVLLGVFGALCLLGGAAEAQMRGHGGPVRAIAISPDGRLAISGGFDQAAILWDIDAGAARRVLRFHDGAVNAVAALPDAQFATASEDGRIALWTSAGAEPLQVLSGHKGPIVALAVSPDGRSLASASWDETARIWTLSGGAGRAIEGHKGNVNAVAFLPDGRLVTGGYDATVRIWAREGDAAAPIVAQLPSPVNALAVAADGEIAAAGADFVVRFLRTDGTIRAEAEIGPAPVIALAMSPDGARVAAATAGGAVAIVERATGRVLNRLVGPGLPVWSLAWRPDGAEIVTGGSDRLVRRWSAETGKPVGPMAMSQLADPLAEFAGDRGADVFRACVACHSLQSGEGERAGPSLAGIFGRRIATAPDYRFSEPLRKMDIVWDARTIAELFEVGPARYTPGTKMPEQTITSAADREALVRFLERATKPR
jgi:cytochrome c